MDVMLPARLHGYRGVSERSEMKSVVDLEYFERRKDLVFVKVEENVFPGRPKDMVAIAGKWLYVIADGAIVVRAEALSASDWDVDSQVFGGRRHVGDSTLVLLPARTYTFFLSPFPLSSRAEQYLLDHVTECETVSNLEASENDAVVFVRDAYLWSLDLHNELYAPRVNEWRAWVANEERAARLFIASSLKCLIDEKDKGWLYDSTDPLDLRDELNEGEPERFLEEVYQKEEQRLRTEAERAMAQLALMLESYDYRTLELSACDDGDLALELSLVTWAGVLEYVSETLPGRVFAARLVADESRIPLAYVLTLEPPSNSPDFALVRYLSNAVLAILKNLASAWIAVRVAEQQIDPLAHMQRYLERLSGEGPLWGTYRQMHKNLAKSKPLTQGVKRPQQARKKLVRKSGLVDAQRAAADPGPVLAKSERLSQAYVRNLGTVDASYRLVLEVVNLANALSDVKTELSARRLLSVAGAAADFGALITESLEIILKESSHKAVQRTAAGLGIISGICDCIEFALSGKESAERYDYDQAIGHSLAAAGAAMVAVGSALALCSSIAAGATAAAAGASAAGILGSVLAGGAVGGIVGIVGGALIGTGVALARVWADSSFQEFAKVCFLGQRHAIAGQDWSWTSILLPTTAARQEMVALVHLLSSFRVAIEDDSGVTIFPGLYQPGDVFEIYLERHYEDHSPNAALIEADPTSGEIHQVRGIEMLADRSRMSYDATGRAERIYICDALAEQPEHEPVRMIQLRMMRVRLRLAVGSFVPPASEADRNPQWTQVEFQIGALGPDLREATSAEKERRADLGSRPFLVMRSYDQLP